MSFFKPRVAAVSCSLTKAKVTSLVFFFLKTCCLFFVQKLGLTTSFPNSHYRRCLKLIKGEFVDFTKYESLLALVFVHSWVCFLHWQGCCALMPWMLLNLSGERILLKLVWTYFSLTEYLSSMWCLEVSQHDSHEHGRMWLPSLWWWWSWLLR